MTVWDEETRGDIPGSVTNIDTIDHALITPAIPGRVPVADPVLLPSLNQSRSISPPIQSLPSYSLPIPIIRYIQSPS